MRSKNLLLTLTETSRQQPFQAQLTTYRLTLSCAKIRLRIKTTIYIYRPQLTKVENIHKVVTTDLYEINTPRDIFTSVHKIDTTEIAGGEEIPIKILLDNIKTPPLLTQPPSQYSPPVDALDALDSPLPRLRKDASAATRLASESAIPPETASWPSMTRFLASTSIGCTKILEHIWMAGLNSMASDNRYGKSNFFSPNAMTYHMDGLGRVFS